MADLQLNRDPDMLDRLEQDLMDKVTAAYAEFPEVSVEVYGVFDLEDMERLQESSLGNQLAVGVGYLGADRIGDNVTTDRGAPAARIMLYTFVILLAVPATDVGANRHSATRLMTIMRNKILGTKVAGDNTQRTWNIVREKPEISESNRNMLYYSQVWQVAIPSLGNLA